MPANEKRKGQRPGGQRKTAPPRGQRRVTSSSTQMTAAFRKLLAACRREHDAAAPDAGRLLGLLRKKDAFCGLRDLRCERALAERKIAETLAVHLHRLKRERLFYEERGEVERKAKAFSVASRHINQTITSLEKVAPKLASLYRHLGVPAQEGAEHFADLIRRWTDMVAVPGKRGAGWRGRKSDLVGEMLCDVTAVLMHACDMSQTCVVRDVLPNILDTFAEAHPDVPRNGVGDPETRLKRFLRKQGAGSALERSELGLFGWDSRFPLDLYLRQRPRRGRPRRN
jgi:hypothetical protein